VSTVELERHDAVALIRMNRPETLNAFDPPMLDALVDTVRACAAATSVRAIVLTGGPRAFTTGEDLVKAATLDEPAFRRQIGQFQALATALRFAPQPVVAAVAGPAYGGGLEIALNCDVRIAADNARFACPEVEWSLTLSNGSSVLLRRAVSDSWARELLLFGAVLDAPAALKTGLVSRVVPLAELETTALAMAQKAATFGPRAMRLTKELLNADPRPWSATVAAELDAVVDGFTDESARERLRRFAERKGGSSS
jgi:enoyl-CoA hydratase/carnithine racemase